MGNKIIIYHGSEHIIKNPIYGFGKKYNDYGLGFYTTEDCELAKEWAVSINKGGYANKYEFDLSDLKILNLSNYNVLHWITILLQNRFFEVKTDIASIGKDFLLKNYLLPYEKYDVIIGYRADDSYFQFAQSFLNNTISISRLEEALKLGNLGEQIVLKSEKAFNQLKYIDSIMADNKIYYQKREKRNEDARNNFLLSRRKKLSINDIFLNDLIRGDKK